MTSIQNIWYHQFGQIYVQLDVSSSYIPYANIFSTLCSFMKPWQPKSKSFGWQYFVLGTSCRQLSCMACKSGWGYEYVEATCGNYVETMEQPSHVYWRCHVCYCEWNWVSRPKYVFLSKKETSFSGVLMGTVLLKKAIARWGVSNSETHPWWICKPT